LSRFRWYMTRPAGALLASKRVWGSLFTLGPPVFRA